MEQQVSHASGCSRRIITLSWAARRVHKSKLHTQIKHPSTQQLTHRAVNKTSWQHALDTGYVSTQGPVGLPTHCALPDPFGFYRETTHISQKPSSSIITFAAQGLLVLSRLAQCTAPTLQHFQGHTTDPGALSYTPELHCHDRSSKLNAKIACGSSAFAP